MLSTVHPTRTLVENCLVHTARSAPGLQEGAPEEEEILSKNRSKKIPKKYSERKKNAFCRESFPLPPQGTLLAFMASRLGQCGRAEGYVLEGKELEFYVSKIESQEG
ncbi:hypothetical protein A6R68_07978, partial [Neotoma lepida]